MLELRGYGWRIFEGFYSLSLSLTALAVSFFIFAAPVQAALYAPGETLDPACAPTDVDCGVETVGEGTIGQVPYYAGSGAALTATSSMTLLSNGHVGIGTTSPFTTLSVTGNIFSTGSITANQLFQNTQPVASARLAYRDLLFYDDFNRADTSLGQLGVSSSGHAYDLRGVSALSPLTTTNIQGGRWVSDAGDVAYAIQTLPTNVTRLGGVVSWQSGNGGGSPGVFTMIISPDKTGSNLYLNAGAHVTITRTAWTIQYISNGVFVTVESGSFSSTLLDDGTSYSFEVTINGPVMYYSFAGVTGSASSPFFVSNAGRYATWEHYYASASVDDLLRIEAVWAGTTPISSGNLYDLASAGTVGIGTSSPLARLDVAGSASQTTPLFQVSKVSGAYATTTSLIVDSTGKLGIGTSTPDSSLTVGSPNGYDGNLLKFFSTTEPGLFNLTLNSTVSSGVVKYSFDITNSGSSYLNNLVLDRGNVGIGTSTPRARLDLAGLNNGSAPLFQISSVASFATTTRLIVDSTGKLGLGVATPTLRLDVAGTSGFPATSGTAQNGALRVGYGSTPTLDVGMNSTSGGWIQATNNANLAVNYALLLNPNGGNVGVGTTTPWRTFSVAGTMALSGLTSSATGNALCITTAKDITDAGGASCVPSSIRFKEHVETLPQSFALDELNKLRVVSFDYKDGFYSTEDSPGSYGLIAEEVAEVDSKLVDYGYDGQPLTLKFEKLTGLAIQAIQELSKVVAGFADSVTTAVLNAAVGNFSDKICVGATCLTEPQLQALLKDSNKEPSPQESAPIVPVEPAPVQPIPVQPLPVEPIPAEPIPVEPVPVPPVPTEPAPVEPVGGQDAQAPVETPAEVPAPVVE